MPFENSLMKYFRLIILFTLCVYIFSCSTKKNIIYIQDADDTFQFSVNYNEHEVNIDDILKIDVGSENPEAALVFNQSGLTASNFNNRESILYNGYQVNSDGNINFPILGKINVEGMTINKVRDTIYNSIIDKDILRNPSVDVKLLNAYFVVLGEVSKPGRYEFLKNNMNILEAIGNAGDLTITGDRKKIKVIREKNGNNKVYSIDLTKSDFLSSEVFQIYSGDIIIVNPNTTRIKNAGIIGNSGTLISLLSFVLSSIIVINN